MTDQAEIKSDKEPVVGIDLGTSNSVVSVMIDGQVHVIPDERGDQIHASVVAFFPDDRIMVGNEAKAQMGYNPFTTVYSAKRLIGRKFYSSEVKKAMAVVPYKIAEGPNKDVRIEVRDRLYSVPEISAFVLKKMKAIAERYLNREVKKAVVTCPAYFNDGQRQATKDAGRIAGLEVLRIINEPTAAALAYGYGKGLNQRIVIYDLGGGTFDISVLDLGENIFEVISTAGDTYLGGDDFDDRIVDYLAEQFMEKENVDLRSDKVNLQKLKEAAEKAKWDLSANEKVEVFIPAIEEGQNGPIDLRIQITRKHFNDMTMDLVQRSFKVCDEALQTAGLTSGDIEGVVLVGGSTRIPLVKEAVGKYFFKSPKIEIDPDKVISIGAAIQGATLLGQDSKGSLLIDVTPLTLGILTVGGYIETLIERNTPVPTEASKIFVTSTDNQSSVKISVYQGESKRSEENEMLGEFVLKGIRPAPRGEVKIMVIFEIDSDGIVNVSAKDIETGKAQSIQINVSGGLSAQEIDEMAKKNKEANLPATA